MIGKIALEEHFLVPGVEPYWGRTVEDVPPPVRDRLYQQLSDFGDMRLEAMDSAGIRFAVLSVAGPGVQAEPDARLATRIAREANDLLAEQVRARPDRYGGLAHLALQDPAGAASELERSVTELGLAGVMINGHTNGHYLDAPGFYPFWERAEALGVPVYLHPTDPVAPAPALEGHRALRRATWEWTFETGSHALRLVFSGLFDRFPNVTLVLGHLGEALPYMLWRFDSRARLYGVELGHPPSEYIRRNIAVTTSGMNSIEPLRCSLDALGEDRVMFSADYPFETITEASEFIDNAPIDDSLRARICAGNAIDLFALIPPGIVGP
jgi:2,3-dihydroxybenzoate decarboxylase